MTRLAAMLAILATSCAPKQEPEPMATRVRLMGVRIIDRKPWCQPGATCMACGCAESATACGGHIVGTDGAEIAGKGFCLEPMQ